MYQDLSKYKYTIKQKHGKLYSFFYHIVVNLFVKTTPKPLYKWRNAIYRMFGAKLGKNVRIDPKATLLYPWNIEIGDNVWIGYNCDLYSSAKIKIGNNVALAHNVFLATAAHDVTRVNFPTICAPIVIEDEVWISSNVFVQQGVTIHKGAVVAACSLVTKDMPEGMICMGHPAKPVKKREVVDNL